MIPVFDIAEEAVLSDEKGWRLPTPSTIDKLVLEDRRLEAVAEPYAIHYSNFVNIVCMLWFIGRVLKADVDNLSVPVSEF